MNIDGRSMAKVAGDTGAQFGSMSLSIITSTVNSVENRNMLLQPNGHD